ncbi:MAG: AAA family ATPase [Candidatus Aegiribacteria sp.]|nr:AAA family ATPase [Candidatus Aegiribacteria sp.]
MSEIVVALGSDFLSAYSRIPKKQQGKVREFIRKFKLNPKSSGINYERIHDSHDSHIWSVRIDQAYRGIVHRPDSGSTFILLWVDHHDEAYDWARRRKVVIHPETGSLQVLDVEASEMPVEISSVEKELCLFRKLKDRHLRQFGVPEILIPKVSSLVSEEELEDMSASLPEEAMECLQMFNEGFDLDEILNDVACDGKIDTDDYGSALERDGSKRFFWVVDDELELAEMLAAPLEKWRVFLHPSQRRLVERDWNGPVRVLGGAGTGKTVVAMHRAKWLAENSFTGPNDRILFTTFTRNLAGDIRENLRKITPADVMKRIEVVNLDEWVWNFLKRSKFGCRIAYGKVTKDVWEKALSLSPEGYQESFFREEWDRVIQPQGIDTLREYLTCSRTGRGTRLARRQRKDIWQVFEEYRRLLDEAGLREPADAMRDVRHILESKPGILPYRAVVVDEAQDMGPQEFKLIRQIVPEAGNDIFIVGDAHQRIYGKRVVLSRAGINIRGRGRKLRINYRTTEENRNWAVRLINGLSFDDLDGGIDAQEGYRSLVHGVSPEIHAFESFDEEIEFIVSRLVPMLASPGQMSSVCIAARTNSLLKQYADELASRGIATCFVKRNQEEDRSTPGVRLATMHRVKGLEFDTMIVAGANEGVVPLPTAVLGSDDITRREGEKSEKALLYVAATRARKHVIITGLIPLSRFLKYQGN